PDRVPRRANRRYAAVRDRGARPREDLPDPAGISLPDGPRECHGQRARRARGEPRAVPTRFAPGLATGRRAGAEVAGSVGPHRALGGGGRTREESFRRPEQTTRTRACPRDGPVAHLARRP